MRYIDADEIKIPKMVSELDNTKMRVMIASTPTADVVPVKHGKWIKIIEDFDIDEPLVGRCSACGWFAGMYEGDVVGMNYCPNCGAKMDGESK